MASVLIAEYAIAAQAGALYGAGRYTGSDPIGGGPGYSRRVLRIEAKYKVATKADLLACLKLAVSGDIIWIEGTAEIDLSGCADLGVNDGVTVAGDRGLDGSPGGLIFTNTTTYSWDQLFRPGNHVRFTGIRLRGPDGEIGTNGAKPQVAGIWCSGKVGLEVDNCELYQWPFAGIAYYVDGLGGDLENPDRAEIHHNYFHHNRRDGLGYGVSVGLASAHIWANLFDYGRHFIEGERGTPGTCYLAEYNVFGPNCTHTLVDCHGGNDQPADGFAGGPDPTVPAGKTLKIRWNTFMSATQPSVKPRGVPADICDCYGNWSYHTGSSPTSGAFRQETDHLGLTGYQNMKVHGNWYGKTAPPDDELSVTVEVVRL